MYLNQLWNYRKMNPPIKLLVNFMKKLNLGIKLELNCFRIIWKLCFWHLMPLMEKLDMSRNTSKAWISWWLPEYSKLYALFYVDNILQKRSQRLRILPGPQPPNFPKTLPPTSKTPPHVIISTRTNPILQRFNPHKYPLKTKTP